MTVKFLLYRHLDVLSEYSSNKYEARLKSISKTWGQIPSSSEPKKKV
jgi:hypothetical protein